MTGNDQSAEHPKPEASDVEQSMLDFSAMETREDSPEVVELLAQIADLEDRLKRAFAEQQNQRQRMLKEKVNADRYAGSRLATDFLDVIDNLERAIISVPISLSDNEHINNLTAGVKMVLEQMVQVLATHNIRKINPMGEVVNYELHETVTEVDDNPAVLNHVVDVLQPGYVMHDRLLRPAKVVISSGRMREDNAVADPVNKEI